MNGWPINSRHSYRLVPGAVKSAPMVFSPIKISDRLKPNEGALLQRSGDGKLMPLFS